METDRFIMTAVSTERQSALKQRTRIAGMEKISGGQLGKRKVAIKHAK